MKKILSLLTSITLVSTSAGTVIACDNSGESKADNAATRQYGMSYSVFMNGLKKLDIQLNRKMLSELAIHEPTVFKGLVDQVKANQK